MVECIRPGVFVGSDRATRRRLDIQRNRLVTFTLAAAVAVLLKELGAFAISWNQIGLIYLASMSSTAALFALYWFDPPWSRPLRLTNFWLVYDVAATSWGIYVSGG